MLDIDRKGPESWAYNFSLPTLLIKMGYGWDTTGLKSEVTFGQAIFNCNSLVRTQSKTA